MQPEQAWRGVAWLFGGPGAPRGDVELPEEVERALDATDPRHLEAEYVRLFVNALPEVPCPPWASVHLEGVLEGVCTRRVRDLYRRWGVAPEGTPDHFALEAAFLAGLLEAAAVEGGGPGGEGAGAVPRGGARDAGTDGAALRDLGWLAGHLRAWAPGFLDAVEADDRTGVWAAGARWARTLLGEDLAATTSEARGCGSGAVPPS